MAEFLFLLNKSDIDASTRCFQFAHVAHVQGHKVEIFLTDDGVLWADKNRDLNVKSKTGDCPGDFMQYLVDNEVQISV